ncbi:MAG: prenyltransferase [Candidatus Muiribacteriota bacterium]
MKNLLIWYKSLRAYSFLMSVFPPLLIFFYLQNAGYNVDFLKLIPFIAVVILIHSGVNVLNDYYDYVFKVDTEKSAGASLLIQKGFVKPKFMYYSGLIYFILGIITGSILALNNNILLYTGIPAVFLSFLYTSRKFSLKYNALGEITVFTLFGPLLFFSSVLYMNSVINFEILILSTMFGLLTAAVLIINNIRDMESDSNANIKTIPILFGKKTAYLIYLIIMSLLIWFVFTELNFFSSFIILIFVLSIFTDIIRRKIRRLDIKTSILYGLTGFMYIVNNLL